MINTIEAHSDIITLDLSHKILQGALNLLSRKDAHLENFYMLPYSLIATLFEKMPDACIALIEQNIMTFINMLIESSKKPLNDETHLYICPIIQTICGRLKYDSLSDENALLIIQNILNLFKSRNTIIEEGLQAIGAVAINIGPRFYKFLQDTGAYFIFAIQVMDSISILKSGIICLGDISRALGEAIGPYISEFFPHLMTVLESPDVTLDIKILCIWTISDIITAVKTGIIPYLSQIFSYLDSAAGASLQITNNSDMDYYLLELREAILDFYANLFQGLQKSSFITNLEERVYKIFSYISIIIDKKFEPTKGLHKYSISLLGDIGVYFDSIKLPENLHKYLQEFIDEQELQKDARWALSQAKC